jgi:GR25 family glycosyltransferase involved in LPS biosynthesis
MTENLPVFVLAAPIGIDKKRREHATQIATQCNGTIIDGIYDDETRYKELDNGTINIHESFKPTSGQLGAMLGHIKILNKIVNEKIEKSIILEDDAEFSKEDLVKYSNQLISAPDYDLYYLWYPHWVEKSFVKNSDGSLLIHQPFIPLYSIVAYSITYEGAKKVLDQLKNMCYGAIDVMYISMILNGVLKAYISSIPVKSLGCQFQAAIDDGSSKNEYNQKTPSMPSTLSQSVFIFNKSMRILGNNNSTILSKLKRHKTLRGLDIDIHTDTTTTTDLTRFNVFLGENGDSNKFNYNINIPQWTFYTQEINSLLKRKETLIINKDFCGFMETDYIEPLFSNIVSYGNIQLHESVKNNSDTSTQYMNTWISKPETFGLEQWRADKMFKICNKYKFFLCTNIIDMLHAYYSGCIPITSFDTKVFNKESFIYCSDESYMDKLKLLNTNDTEYIKVRNTPIFTTESLKYIENFDIDGTLNNILTCYQEFNNNIINDFIFVEGLDSRSDDIYFRKDTLNNMLKSAKNDKNCVGFNTLGFFKKKVNYPLVTSNYIKKENSHGIYIKKEFYKIDAEDTSKETILNELLTDQSTEFVCENTIYDDKICIKPNQTILITTFYNVKYDYVFRENKQTIMANCENTYIDKIIVFFENYTNNDKYKFLLNDKIHIINTLARQSYKMLFNYANINLKDAYVIIANTDILFDNTVNRIKEISYNSKKLLALTRWERIPNTIEYKLELQSGKEGAFSFDSYIFKSPLDCDVNTLDIKIGLNGCDNYLSKKLCYDNLITVENPCIDIRTYHIDRATRKRPYLQAYSYWNETDYPGIWNKSFLSLVKNIPNKTEIFTGLRVSTIDNGVFSKSISHEKLRMSKKLKVIGFCLWGDNKNYNIGALKNAELALELYPTWECWFYIHIPTVPIYTISKLKQYPNVKIIEKTGNLHVPRMWRFEPIDDPNVEIMISRDVDTRILLREKYAVDEWLNSGKTFHIMRDHPHHHDKILAGMFGTKKISWLPKWIEMFNNVVVGENKTIYYDQTFLREYIYPSIKHDCLVHTCFFKYEGEMWKNFPTEYIDNHHVGEYVYADDSRCDTRSTILRDSKKITK